MSVAINDSTGVEKEKYNQEFGTTEDLERSASQTYWSVDCIYCSS